MAPKTNWRTTLNLIINTCPDDYIEFSRKDVTEVRNIITSQDTQIKALKATIESLSKENKRLSNTMMSALLTPRAVAVSKYKQQQG